MKLAELQAALGLEALTPGEPEREVSWGFCSDLLSDVLAHARPQELWITHQRHLNVVAVAKLRGVAGWCACGASGPPPGCWPRRGRKG